MEEGLRHALLRIRGLVQRRLLGRDLGIGSFALTLLVLRDREGVLESDAGGIVFSI